MTKSSLVQDFQKKLFNLFNSRAGDEIFPRIDYMICQKDGSVILIGEGKNTFVLSIKKAA